MAPIKEKEISLAFVVNSFIEKGYKILSISSGYSMILLNDNKAVYVYSPCDHSDDHLYYVFYDYRNKSGQYEYIKKFSVRTKSVHCDAIGFIQTYDIDEVRKIPSIINYEPTLRSGTYTDYEIIKISPEFAQRIIHSHKQLQHSTSQIAFILAVRKHLKKEGHDLSLITIKVRNNDEVYMPVCTMKDSKEEIIKKLTS